MPRSDSPKVPIKAWTDGVPVEPEAMAQVENLARMPFVFRHVALMPDVHKGIGATVGSVVATEGAIIPAAVGVDIGCGMMAVETTLEGRHLPDNLKALRRAIESAVPHGRTDNGGRNDRGAWGRPPPEVQTAWTPFERWLKTFSEKHPKVAESNGYRQLGTLGTGNHFIEVCLDERDQVWFMLHSGSRGMGNRIGSYFIELAKRDMGDVLGTLPDKDLAYLKEGTKHFDDYVEAVGFAQQYARENREVMMRAIVTAVRRVDGLPPFATAETAVNCHHNYVERERHFGHDVLVTRKGAVRARMGDLGIIPGCFAAGTRILMADGLYKSIETLTPGDVVISGDGMPTEVTQTFERGKRRTCRYRNNNFHAATIATPDHLHLVGDMSTANYLEEGRVKVLERPNVDGFSKYVWAPLNALPSSYTLLLPRRIDFTLMVPAFSVEEEGFALASSYELGYVFGAFLGDGTSYYKASDGGQVAWSFGLGENQIASKLSGALVKSIGAEAKTYATKKVLLVVVHSARLARLFRGFGKKDGKALPASLWSSDPEYTRGLYDGLIDSDGHDNDGVLKFTNTSSRCIEQFSIIHYLRFGYFPSLSVRKPSAGGLERCVLANCKESYRAASMVDPGAVLTKDYQLVQMRWLTMEQADEVDVYDIEVASPNHSFVANNAIVHNSMGTRSYIVRGKGNEQSFESCSHGAGRVMSRTEAKKRFTLADHEAATKGVECRKDKDVLDETPGAYKDIDAVMAAQRDLVDVVHTLKQVVCVKG